MTKLETPAIARRTEPSMMDEPKVIPLPPFQSRAEPSTSCLAGSAYTNAASTDIRKRFAAMRRAARAKAAVEQVTAVAEVVEPIQKPRRVK